MTTTRSPRSGVALLMVLILLLISAGVAHALLLLGHAQRRATEVSVRLVGERVRAMGDLSRVAASPLPDGAGSTPVGSALPLPDSIAPTGATMIRLGWEEWLVLAGTKSHHPRGSLVRWLDPVERVGALPAVVVVGAGATVAGAAAIDPGQAEAVPAGATVLDCDVVQHAVPGRLDPGSLLAWAESVHGLGLPLTSSPSDRFVPDSWVAAALPIDSVLRLGPVERFGSCVREAPGNAGDPLRPHRPCGEHRPLLGRRGSIRVLGGDGQGVLLAQGDVKLSGDAFWRGLVLSNGSVHVADSALVEGFVIAEGGVTLSESARVSASYCGAALALEGAIRLTRSPDWIERVVGPL